ncbi:heme ABC transporter permease/ATP-binding protein CydD [Thorsellia kenyensis]|uniref:Cysteine/glutathione ABC transporter permease/ATP-binding protein CydD n=1 Tax=Thorsellia kenyensis TaxID=1549888 RepID=A0ABV6CC52_9GAMM
MDNSKNQPISKTRQKEITQWLKQQRSVANKWIRLSGVLGLVMTLLLIAQAWMLAWLLQQIIIEKKEPSLFILQLIGLFLIFLMRSLLLITREQVGQKIGHTVRKHVRQQLFSLFEKEGPSALQKKAAGSWSIIVIEQIDNLNDYFAKFLPQTQLAISAPICILISVFWFNWAAGVILLFTAPLIPIFMAFVGMGAAEANRKNFQVLAQLSGFFLDRLKGLETLRIFHRKDVELVKIETNSEAFRVRTMEVLRIAFLSSGVLEFFTSVSIAVMAVYFGFSFLGDLNFGHYGLPMTLFIGFFCLLLAPEFYQPLRDLGTFYHAKAQAIGAADVLLTLDLKPSNLKSMFHSVDNKKDINTNKLPILHVTETQSQSSNGVEQTNSLDCNNKEIQINDWQSIEFIDLVVKTPDGISLTQSINFKIQRGDKIAIFGQSGSGKTSFIHCLMGFLPFEGHILVDGIPLSQDVLIKFRQNIHWLSQNPVLPANTIRDNLNLVASEPQDDVQIWHALKSAKADEFVDRLPNKLDTLIGDNATRLSIGQAQRIALAKLFLVNRTFWILDEPTASLDKENANAIMESIYGTIGFLHNRPIKDELTIKQHSDVTLLLISHDEQHLSFFSKKIELIKDNAS